MRTVSSVVFVFLAACFSGKVPTGVTCESNQQCAAGQFCIASVCRQTCSSNTSCAAGQVCNASGACVVGTGGSSAGGASSGNGASGPQITSIEGTGPGGASGPGSIDPLTGAVHIHGANLEGVTAVHLLDASLTAVGDFVLGSAQASEVDVAISATLASHIASSPTGSFFVQVDAGSSGTARDAVTILQGVPGSNGGVTLAGSGSATTASHSDHDHFGQHWSGMYSDPNDANPGTHNASKASFSVVNSSSATGAGIYGETSAALTGAETYAGVVGRGTSDDGGTGVVGLTDSTNADGTGAGVMGYGNGANPGVVAYNPGVGGVAFRAQGNSDFSSSALRLPISIVAAGGGGATGQTTYVHCASEAIPIGGGCDTYNINSPVVSSCMVATGSSACSTSGAPVLGGGWYCGTYSSGTAYQAQAFVYCLSAY